MWHRYYNIGYRYITIFESQAYEINVSIEIFYSYNF